MSLVGLLAPGCALDGDEALYETAGTAEALTAAGPAYDERSILVKFRDTPGAAALQDVLGLVGGKMQDANRDRKDDRFAQIANGRLARVDLDGSVKVADALARLKKHPSIEYAEPNYIVHALGTPNDPSFNQLWGLNNTGQTGGVAGADISAVDAWDITTGNSDVIIGIIDTGIDYTHPDIAANAWVNPNEIAGNGVDDDGNGYVDDIHGVNTINGSGDPMDDNDHGTHVAGTIGGVGDNGVGVAGVNWTVSMIGIKFLSGSGSGTTADAIESVNYAVDLKNNRGIDLRALNNSWGGGGFSQALFDAIAAANAADILFLAAAGNSATNNDNSPHYPSSYDVPNVVAVASTTHTDGLSSFSCFGAVSVDLGAPGSDIVSTIPGGGYASFSGTSMATPHVTGAAALLLSANNTLTTAELKDILMNSGDSIPALAGKTVSGKRLNVLSALDQAGPPQPRFNLGVTPPSQAINQNGSASYSVSVTSVGGFSAPVSLSLSSTPALDAAVTFTPNPVAVDSTAELFIQTSAATAPGNYTLTITGTSGDLVKSRTVALTVRPEGTVAVSYTNSTPVSIPDNNQTGVTSTITVPDSLAIAEVSVEVNITHTYIGDLIVTLTSPEGTVATLHDRSGGSTDNLHQTYAPTVYVAQVSAGTWTLRVQDVASIDVGTIDSWTLTILGDPTDGGGNTPPVADFTFSTSGLAASFTDLSSDAESDLAGWFWDFGDGTTSTDQHPTHTYAFTGTYAVTLTVIDSAGAISSTTQEVTIEVSEISLSIRRIARRGNERRVELNWSGALGAEVEIFRNGQLIDVSANNGVYRDRFQSTGTTFVYQICAQFACSNEVVAQF